ncbi:MAG: hypothetical protein FWG50_13840 [Kiritimatiellaeota bacterium]|nr:hypothetical protein [Kiritimatiellota bacterium]
MPTTTKRILPYAGALFCALAHSGLFLALAVLIKRFLIAYNELFSKGTPLYDSPWLAVPENILLSGLLLLMVFIGVYVKSKTPAKIAAVIGLIVLDITFVILCVLNLWGPFFRITWRLTSSP